MSREITIRVESGQPNPYFGFGPSHPTKKELATSRRTFKADVRQRVTEDRAELSRLRKSARGSFKGKAKLNKLFHELYGPGENPHGAICGANVQGYPCTRKPGHRGPHLPQGATMRPRTRLRKGWRPNPSAEALREEFSGAPVDRVQIFDEPHMPRGDYALLGKKIVLYVKPNTGGQVLRIELPQSIAVSDESARRIWFVGGDQDVSASLHVFGAEPRGAGLFGLGQARRIDYKQRKEHAERPDVDEWRHDFGEETGEYPTVLFDANAKRLLLEGGAYEIKREGIRN